VALSILRSSACWLLFAFTLTYTLHAGGESAAPAREWKLSTALGPAYPQGKGGEVWARLINERCAGRLVVKHSPGATLSQRDPAREFAALRAGTIELSVGSASNWAGQVPELNLFALPWLIPDASALVRVLEGDVGARLFDRLRAAGVVPLASAGDAFQELASNRALHTPADLAGLRVRAPASPLVTETLLAFGALPAAMSSNDARAALARDELDGELLTVAAFGASRLYASGARHLLLWGAYPDALFFAVNRSAWEGLSDADRDVVRQAAREAAQEAAALARTQASDAALAALARDGASLSRLTVPGKEPFRSRSRPVVDKWSAIIGDDLVRAAEAAIVAR
jgi:TRAP-type C4-dicarboxylate transport system substrate-binding protein